MLGPEDDDQTLTFCLAVTQALETSPGFNFALLNVPASSKNKPMGSNTITVPYRQIAFKAGARNPNLGPRVRRRRVR